METKERSERMLSTRISIEGKAGEWRIIQTLNTAPNEWRVMFQRCDVFSGEGMICFWTDEVVDAIIYAIMSPSPMRLDIDGVIYTVHSSAFR